MVVRDERGQIVPMMVGVMLLAIVLLAGIAVVGSSMVHRARARAASDAVALATVIDPLSASAIADWYQTQGVQVSVGGEQATAASGPSGAAAWAHAQREPVLVAPVLRAVIARAEQLVGAPITVRTWNASSVVLDSANARLLEVVASELLLCSSGSAGNANQAGSVEFQVCS